MKSFIVRIFAPMLFLVMGMAMAAPAQTISTIKVSIPFEFSFGDKTFPAGNYALCNHRNISWFCAVPKEIVSQKSPPSSSSLSGPRMERNSSSIPRTASTRWLKVWLRESYSGLELYKAKEQNFEKGHSVQVSLIHE